MLDNASKAFFHLLARSGTLQKLASRYGMRHPDSFARRFIAGETVEEAIQAARQVQAAGLGPQGQLVCGAWQFEPRRQHPLGLRTLSGRKKCKHSLREHCEDGFAWCKRL